MTPVTVPPVLHAAMDDAVAAIWEARTIVLACHINPDGDALGSMIALGMGLASMGKEVTLLSADGVPDTLAFLPGVDLVRTRTDRRDFDLGIGLDAGDLSRLGPNAEPLLAARRLMDIDHHVTAGRFGDIQLLDATVAATAELVFDLLAALGVELGPEIAENLHCGLLTDTGGFRFTNVSPRNMAIGAALVAGGANPDRIYENVYERRSWAGQKLLGRALETMRRSPDGRIVWTVVRRADFEEFGATDRDTEGIVGGLRVVEGSSVAVVFREMESGKLRVSLRARGDWDVSKVAARFGGGGHRLASGCSCDGPADAAVEAVLRALAEAAPTS